jgi:hypothetical protein
MKFIFSFIFVLSQNVIFSQSSNPIIEANKLIAQMDLQIKNKQFKESIQLDWSNEIAYESEMTPHTSFRYLALPNGYGIKEIKFKGYESNIELFYYCKGTTPFYLILNTSAEGCLNKYKVYYELYEPIKCLRQTNDCMGVALGPIEEIKDDVTIIEELKPFDDLNREVETKIDQYLIGLEENPEVYPLRREIKSINSYADLLNFLDNHSPSFSDLDSLYTLLTNKPCPQDLTSSIVNGDSSIIQTLPKDYLHFVFRNSYCQFSYILNNEKDLRQINDFKDFKSNLADFKSNVNLTVAEAYPLNYSNFSIEQLTLIPSNTTMSIGSNLKQWLPELARNRVSYFPTIYAFSPNLIMYRFAENVFETEYSEDEEIQKNSFESKFATDTYSQNLYRYIQSQVFGDIVFIQINNRWVFFDIDR